MGGGQHTSAWRVSDNFGHGNCANLHGADFEPMHLTRRLPLIYCRNAQKSVMAKLGSSTVVTKKDVNLADGVRFNGHEPVSRSRKATGRGAFEVQSAQAISAAYYFDLAARDYTLADGAIELVIEGVPCSALIEASQSSELIFCDWSARLRGRKHAADGGKFCCDLQEHSGAPLPSSNGSGPGRSDWSSTRAAGHLKRTRREQALAAHHGCRNVIENYRLR